MRRDQAIAILHDLRQQLTRLGVLDLALFGSVARDEGTAGSDVDLLVTFAPGDFWRRYNDVMDLLEAAFPCRVDLVPAGDLKPRLREQVLAEAIRVP